MQNANGPCALLALANACFLQRDMTLPPGRVRLSEPELMSMLADYVSRTADRCDDSDDAERRAARQFAVNDFIDLLPSLNTGMDVNVRFNSPLSFEFTREVSIFDVFPNVRLVHGWLVDPQDTTLMVALARLSYNQLVDELVRTAPPTQVVDWDNVTPEAPPADEFSAGGSANDDGAAIVNGGVNNGGVVPPPPYVDHNPLAFGGINGQHERAPDYGEHHHPYPNPHAHDEQQVQENQAHDYYNTATSQTPTSTTSPSHPMSGSLAQPPPPTDNSDTIVSSINDLSLTTTPAGDDQTSNHLYINPYLYSTPSSSQSPPAPSPAPAHINGDDTVQRNSKESAETEMIRELRPQVVDFIESNPTQLTVYGLLELHQTLVDGEVAVLFRNSHFYVLRKRRNEIFTLVTDEGYLNELNTVWEKLSDVTGDSTFYNGTFAQVRADGTVVRQQQQQQQTRSRVQGQGQGQGQGQRRRPMTTTGGSQSQQHSQSRDGHQQGQESQQQQLGQQQMWRQKKKKGSGCVIQ